MLILIHSIEDLSKQKHLFERIPPEELSIILNFSIADSKEDVWMRELSSYNAYKISLASHDCTIEKKHIYLCPPGNRISVYQNKIYLTSFSEIKDRRGDTESNENAAIYRLREKLSLSNSLLLQQKLENSRNKGLKTLNAKLHTTNESLRFSWNLLKESNTRLESENRILNGNYLSEINYSERITGILNGIPAHLALLDADGIIMEVNEAWKKFASLNQLQDTSYGIGTNYIDVCENASGEFSSNAADVARGIRSVINGTETHFTTEYPCHAENQKRWFKLMVHPLREQAPREVVVMHLNISDRKIAELERQEKEKKYKDLVETSSNIIFSMDSQGNFTFVNKKTFDVLGYEPQELIGKPLLSFIDIGKSEMDVQDFHEKLQQKSLENQELWLLGKEGKSACIRMNSKIIFDEQSDIIEIVGTATDITNKRIAEERLKNSEANLIAIFNSSIQALILIDKNFKIISFNKVAAESGIQMLGKMLQEGSSFLDLIDPSQVPIYKRRFKNALSGNTLSIETKNKMANGDDIWFETTFNPVSSGEETMGVCLSIIDITKRKKDEEKINQQYEELQKANSELDRFVYCASHDLKAPLTSVLGILNVANIDSVTESPKYFEMIGATVNKLMRVINELTNFSRNARVEVEKEEINIKDLIQETIQSLRYLENSKKVTFTIKADSKETFFSDKSRLSILLTNIISNAIIYHNYYQENPEVTVTVTSEPKRFTLIIQDNGIGIEEKHLEKVFNMFYRASQKSAGSGLGLYIVKGIVEKLNGVIDLTSVAGKGTKVVITLPNK